MGPVGIATEFGGEHAEYSGAFVDVTGEVAKERGGEAVSSLLAGNPVGMGQVVGQIVVRGRDGARFRASVFEAQRSAYEFDSVLKVALLVFQVGTRGIDLAKHPDVPPGVEHLLALAQQLICLGQPAEAKKGTVVVKPGAGGLVEASAAPPHGGSDLVVEVEGLRPPIES